jgi:hypothetical protein
MIHIPADDLIYFPPGHLCQFHRQAPRTNGPIVFVVVPFAVWINVSFMYFPLDITIREDPLDIPARVPVENLIRAITKIASISASSPE